MSNHSQLRLKKVRLGSVTRRLSYGSKSRGIAVEEFGTNYPYKKVSGHDTAIELNEFYVLYLCVCFQSISCKIWLQITDSIKAYIFNSTSVTKWHEK